MTQRVELLSPQRLKILRLIGQHGAMTGAELTSKDSTLARKSVYTTLTRLEDAKLLKSRKEERSRQPGPTRRLYRITPLGTRVVALAAELDNAYRNQH
jgi:DNA-binding PadR family transcriptional regulator